MAASAAWSTGIRRHGHVTTATTRLALVSLLLLLANCAARDDVNIVAVTSRHITSSPAVDVISSGASSEAGEMQDSREARRLIVVRQSTTNTTAAAQSVSRPPHNQFSLAAGHNSSRLIDPPSRNAETDISVHPPADNTSRSGGLVSRATVRVTLHLPRPAVAAAGGDDLVDIPPQHDATPRHEATPPQQDATPTRHNSTPTEHGATPPQQDATPTEHGATPTQHEATPIARMSLVQVSVLMCVVIVLLIAGAAAVVFVLMRPRLCRLLKRRSILSDTATLDDTRLSYINASTDFTVAEMADDSLDNLDNDSFLNSLECPAADAVCYHPTVSSSIAAATVMPSSSQPPHSHC